MHLHLRVVFTRNGTSYPKFGGIRCGLNMDSALCTHVNVSKTFSGAIYSETAVMNQCCGVTCVNHGMSHDMKRFLVLLVGRRLGPLLFDIPGGLDPWLNPNPASIALRSLRTCHDCNDGPP